MKKKFYIFLKYIMYNAHNTKFQHETKFDTPRKISSKLINSI